MTSDDERELVREVRRGDATAAWTILMTYGPEMHAAAYRITGDVDLAEDIVQESLLRVMRSSGPASSGALSGWLRAVTVRVALNVLRSERRRSAREAAFVVQASIDSPSEDSASIDDDGVREAIESLPEGERTVLVLIEFEGLSHREVGAALGISAEASRQRLLKARQRLRVALRPSRGSNA